MNYAQIRSMDISNGEGIGVSLFVSGCHFHCKNCFNPETWNFDYGKEFTDEEMKSFIDMVDKPYITRVSLLGGSPLAEENVSAVLKLIEEIKIRFPDKKIWLYTGYKYEDIVRSKAFYTDGDYIEFLRKMVLQYVDYLVDGQYVDELQDFSLKFRGSKNQRIIDVQKSLKENRVIEKENS